uniref:Protein BTN n=1 Tax=Blastobotrys adeninivorans TaxID=409370 RepID=A0A060T0D8_BLAAD
MNALLGVSHNARVFMAFWVFGLVNNVLYVVILSAAIDLVGPEAPKAIVLLADVLPSFLIKLACPFFIQRIPYPVRIASLIALSSVGILTIAFSSTVVLRLAGVVLASLSSGLGETSFLALTHFYEDWSLPGFSSGTGGAGLVGSFAFLVMTTWIGLSVRTSLIVFSAVPFSFWATYALVLPPATAKYELLNPDSESDGELTGRSDESLGPSHVEELANKYNAAPMELPKSRKELIDSMRVTLNRIKPLFVPFMLPLALVYLAEYLINQGISPTLLFPLEEMPFSRYRDAYVTYGTLYQLGVLISRSSSPFFRVRKIYYPSILQAVNTFICILQSLFVIIPNIYILFLLMFYEGLLGGLAYVNTYLLVTETVPLHEREFALGAVGMSDSAGVVMSGIISLWLEKSLCRYQKSTGRPWCDYE